ncbi:MAG: conjugal transfer protein TraN [Xanthobacteraceae bacterium]|nr:conjugal transfer protein TraN [Xanthobacteraceae bacterium]
MRRLVVLAFAMLLATPALAQTPTGQARADGKAFGDAAGKAAAGIADDENNASNNLPGYNGGNAPESTYENNIGALDAAKITASQSPESRLVIDGSTNRPQVPQIQVDQTVARGDIINQNPSTYVQGVDPQGNTGQCVELPPTSTSPGTFEATCNSGSQVVQEAKTCAISLDTKVETKTTTVYDYWVAGDSVYGAPFVRDGQFAGELASGVCKIMPEVMGGCAASRAVGLSPNKFCGNYNVRHFQCSAPIGPEDPYSFIMPISNHWYYATSSASVETVTTARNESLCTPFANDPNCTLTGAEVCTDSSPVTRIIGNTPVTQPCWAWQRDYQCQTIKPANDCSALDTNPACQFNRTECLDDPQQGPCKVEERIYTCPIPGNPQTDKQYLCGGDLYCVGGECEAVTREASDEFKDAAVGMESLAQVNREFDDVDYKLFKGTAMSCHKPVFGLVNCCAGKTSGLIPTAAGFAALASGPAAIAGLATPFLTLFLCSPKEMELDVRDRMGLCHTLGSYCSGSFLGICTTKRRSSCCFLSKLTRVLQEQGRAQINKSWGTPKTPDCSGFTINEFAQLDLSKMDFTEVYKEFVDAAKVPDESATMTDIQAKIRAYYSQRGH